MIFHSRHEAGKKLAEKLQKYNGRSDVIVLGLARGGMIIASEIAQALSIPLNVIMARKIGAPINPEFAIGAITESGIGFFDDRLIRQLQVSEEYLRATITKEKEQANKGLSLYRKQVDAPELADKTVIIVDDGMATGATMKAAIRAIRAENAKHIIVALPVAPIDGIAAIKEEADTLICLHTPDPFYSVSQFYFDFPPVPDEEVISLLRKTPRVQSA